MNNKKIAFIICVNGESEFEECAYYLNRLELPEGYEKDIISVREADSMAAGYNAAMESSDAKYKVYLHQDTFLWKKNVIMDMLTGFNAHPEIGIMGVVGVSSPIVRGNVISQYDTGVAFHNLVPAYRDYDGEVGREPVDEFVQSYVNALDGLLLMTQYDVKWREALFTGWDFYDASQCQEFIRAGFRVAVPRQAYPWAFHDCGASKYRNYAKYREIFWKEYFPGRKDELDQGEKQALDAFEEKMARAKEALAGFVALGKHRELWEFFADPMHCGYVRLREWELIARIDGKERSGSFGDETAMPTEGRESTEKVLAVNGETVTPSVWLDEDGSAEAVLERLRILKHCILRLQFHADEDGLAERTLQCYSDMAIEEMEKVCLHGVDPALFES